MLDGKSIMDYEKKIPLPNKQQNLPIKTAISQIQHVRNRARTGSPPADCLRNGSKKGIIPSFAIACRSRGAPVND